MRPQPHSTGDPIVNEGDSVNPRLGTNSIGMASASVNRMIVLQAGKSMGGFLTRPFIVEAVRLRVLARNAAIYSLQVR